MRVKLLTGHHLEFLSLKGNCTGSPESTLVKMPHCWKSHATAQISEGVQNIACTVCHFSTYNVSLSSSFVSF